MVFQHQWHRAHTRVRIPAAHWMAKNCQVKPTVNNILRAGSIKVQICVQAISLADEAELRAKVAAKVMPTFSAPLPDKVRGVPSQRHCALVLGMPRRTLSQVDNILIKKHQQLTAGKKGVYWALAKCKKRYSTIN